MVQPINTGFLTDTTASRFAGQQLSEGLGALGKGIATGMLRREEQDRLQKEAKAKEDQQKIENAFKATQLEVQRKGKIFSGLTQGETDINKKIKIAKAVYPDYFNSVNNIVVEMGVEVEKAERITQEVIEETSDKFNNNEFKNGVELQSFLDKKIQEKGGAALSKEQKEGVTDLKDELKERRVAKAQVEERAKQAKRETNEVALLLGIKNPSDMTPSQRLEVDKFMTLRKNIAPVDADTALKIANQDKNISRLKRIKQEFKDPKFTKQFGVWTDKWKTFSNKWLGKGDVDFAKASSDIKGLIDILYDISGKQLAVQEMEIVMNSILPNLAGSPVNAEVMVDKLIERMSEGVMMQKKALADAGKYTTLQELSSAYQSFADASIENINQTTGNSQADVVKQGTASKYYPPSVNTPELQKEYDEYLQLKKQQQGGK